MFVGFTSANPTTIHEARILVDTESAVVGNRARKASKMSVGAVASSSLSMSAWGLVEDLFETSFIVKRGPHVGSKSTE